jgi:hypothetical protein
MHRYPIPKRASATQEELVARRTTHASTRRTGENRRLYQQDSPSLSGNITDVEEDDSYYPKPMSSSARRYTTTQGHQVIEQGSKRIVIHNEPPPKAKRQYHWMLFVGLTLFTMVVGWIALTLLVNWWQTKQVEWKYGNPRTFQTDHYVGHADSIAHPNHFIAVNVGGSIQVIELNPANPKTDHIYVITTASDPSLPVSLSFADANHDGKVDLFVTIGGSYTVILLNDGTQFKQ